MPQRRCCCRDVTDWHISRGRRVMPMVNSWQQHTAPEPVLTPPAPSRVAAVWCARWCALCGGGPQGVPLRAGAARSRSVTQRRERRPAQMPRQPEPKASGPPPAGERHAEERPKDVCDAVWLAGGAPQRPEAASLCRKHPDGCCWLVNTAVVAAGCAGARASVGARLPLLRLPGALLLCDLKHMELPTELKHITEWRKPKQLRLPQ